MRCRGSLRDCSSELSKNLNQVLLESGYKVSIKSDEAHVVGCDLWKFQEYATLTQKE